MSEYVVSAQESNVTIDGNIVSGLQSLEYKVERGQIINYRAEAEGVVIENLVDRLLKSVKEKVTK